MILIKLPRLSLLYILLTSGLFFSQPALALGPPASDSSAVKMLVTATGPGAHEVSPSITNLPLLPEGAAWNSAESFVFSGDRAVLQFDLNESQSLQALLIQADNNDSYIVEYSLDGENWQWLWTAPPIDYLQGLRTRDLKLPAPMPVRFLRVRPAVGDKFFSVSRLIAFRNIPSWWDEFVSAPKPWNGLLPALNEERTNALRPFVAVLGIIGLLWCLLARSGHAPPGLVRAGKRFLVTAGLISFACWWNFFNFHYPHSVHLWDFYHYYIGAKYFPELGYTGIYECSARADIESGLEAEVMKSTIRDLQTNELAPAQHILSAANCKQNFSVLRWSEFKEDIAWFRSQNSPQRWAEQRQDHGYNGTPVWRIAAALLTHRHTVSDSEVSFLAAIDSLLLLVMWMFVVWAFGFEAACAAAIYWGTNFPGRFFWTGGSFLRHDWLCHAVISLCLLKRGYTFSSGALLAYSALLRIFPGFIFLGAIAQVIYSLIAKRTFSLSREQKRFALGAFVSAAVLISVGWLSSGRTSPYREFIANSEKHLATPLTNNMGLKMLLSYRSDTRAEVLKDSASVEPYARWKEAHKENIRKNRILFWSIGLLYLALLTYAVRGLPLWAALCLGSTAIPIFAELTCYYYSILMLLGLLWSICPLGVLGLALLAWLTNVCASLWTWYDAAYTAMSALTVIFVLMLLAFFHRLCAASAVDSAKQ